MGAEEKKHSTSMVASSKDGSYPPVAVWGVGRRVMPFGVGQSVESMLMYNGRGRPPFRLVAGGELYLSCLQLWHDC